MRRLGLALGGGGVRGLAEIPVLELLDEIGWTPCAITGTSTGALIGALYASGMPGREIRQLVGKYLISHDENLRTRIKKGADLLKWAGLPLTDLGHGGVIKPDRFLGHLLEGIPKRRFEDLDFPLAVIATDFWTGEEIVLQSGELLPAIRASIAIPGVFSPLPLGDRVLVDGGLVNLVPFNHLEGKCDVTIAVDVGRAKLPGRTDLPGVLESILGAFDIMQAEAFRKQIEARPPDIHVHVQITGIRILDFAKAEAVFEQARPAVRELREAIIGMGLG